jgi:hypothetical protein
MGACQSRETRIVVPSTKSPRRIRFSIFKQQPPAGSKGLESPVRKRLSKLSLKRKKVQVIPDVGEGDSSDLDATPQAKNGGSRALFTATHEPLLTEVWSPSETTAAETDDEPSPSPAPTLSSMYLASPMQTIIPEEEDPGMPSDEEDSMYVTNDVPIDEVSGKLAKSFRHTPASQRVFTMTPPTPLRADSKDAVNQDTVSHFQNLKLQVRLQHKSEEKQRYQAKLEERIHDVQTYRQLWTEYQDIQNDVSSIDSVRGGGPRERSTSFDLQESENWYFDFQSVDFAFEEGRGGDDDESQCSQANLSLMSGLSLEAQRRYYSEKKRLQKRNKKDKHRGTKSVSSNNSQTRSVKAGGSSVTSFGSRDYGPPRRSMAARIPPNDTALQNMEVSIPDLIASSSTSRRTEGDDASYVSDLGDGSTLGSHSQYDYGVRRRGRLAAQPAPQNSLQSKLDSLEDAVAVLRNNHAEQLLQDTSGPGSLGGPSNATERMTIVQVSDESTTRQPPPDSPSDNDSGSTSDSSAPSIPERENILLPPNERWRTDHLQAVQETSYTSADESFQSDFGDLRAPVDSGGLLGNPTYDDASDQSEDVDPLEAQQPVESEPVVTTEVFLNDPQQPSPPPPPSILVSPSPEDSHDSQETSYRSNHSFESNKSGTARKLEESAAASLFHLGRSPTKAEKAALNQEDREESESPFKACSQMTRLLQKTHVHNMSTDQFRRLSYRDANSKWTPYGGAEQQPFDEDESTVAAEDESETASSTGYGEENSNYRYESDENGLEESTAHSFLLLLPKTSLVGTSENRDSRSPSPIFPPLEDLELADQVDNQISVVLSNWKEANEFS